MLRKFLFGLLVLSMLAVPLTAAAAPAAPVAAPDVATVGCVPYEYAYADVPRVDPVIRLLNVRSGDWTSTYAGVWDITFNNGYVVHVPVYLQVGQCIFDWKYQEVVVPISAIEGATTVKVHFSRGRVHLYDATWALWELPWAPAGFNPPLPAGWQGVQFDPKEPGNTPATTIGVWGVTAAGKEVWLDDGFTSEHVSRVAWVGAYTLIRLKFCAGTPWLCKAVSRSVYDENGVLIGKGKVVDVPLPGASVVLSVQ